MMLRSPSRLKSVEPKRGYNASVLAVFGSFTLIVYIEI